MHLPQQVPLLPEQQRVAQAAVVLVPRAQEATGCPPAPRTRYNQLVPVLAVAAEGWPVPGYYSLALSPYSTLSLLGLNRAQYIKKA